MPPDWPGCTREGSLLLHLDAAEYARVPDVLELPECTLARKTEFHVTVLGRAAGAALAAALESARIAPDALIDAWHQQDWRFKRSGRCRLLHRMLQADPIAGRSASIAAWSVIETIDLPAMAAFRMVVSRLAGLELPEAPPHVTLLVAGDQAGIGIVDAAALAALSVRTLTAAEAALACTGRVRPA
jgi:hypothetical protein